MRGVAEGPDAFPVQVWVRRQSLTTTQGRVVAQVKPSLASCPRCSGKVFLNKDYDGLWEECLQCGWEREVTEADLRRLPARVTSPAPLRSR
jgi:hypothetical protein